MCAALRESILHEHNQSSMHHEYYVSKLFDTFRPDMIFIMKTKPGPNERVNMHTDT